MSSYQTMHQQTAALHYEGQDNSGRPIIIDAAELSPSHFEIMAMRPGTWDELDAQTVHTIPDAEAAYKAMMARYVDPKPKTNPKPTPALTGKYAKLRDDLRQALAAGRAAEEANPEDGGTCNFDACRLYLPRWIAAKVEQAAEEAGTSCFVWRLFGGSRYVFAPNSHAQANARSRNAEAMTKALRDLGYDALDYCAMD